jgi:hypothetical protein
MMMPGRVAGGWATGGVRRRPTGRSPVPVPVPLVVARVRVAPVLRGLTAVAVAWVRATGLAGLAGLVPPGGPDPASRALRLGQALVGGPTRSWMVLGLVLVRMGLVGRVLGPPTRGRVGGGGIVASGPPDPSGRWWRHWSKRSRR